jgi:hypothetical protein
LSETHATWLPVNAKEAVPPFFSVYRTEPPKFGADFVAFHVPLNAIFPDASW